MNLRPLQQYLEQLDWQTLLLPAALLLFIGHKVVSSHAKARAFVTKTAGLAFLILFGVQMYWHWPVYGELLTEILLRSLTVSGLLLGSSWIVAPALSGLYQNTLGVLLKSMWRGGKTFFRGISRIITGPVRFLSQRGAHRRQAAEHERRRSEQKTLAKTKAIQQKRRDDARAACELLYHRHAHILSSRFPKAIFEDFMLKYMSDGHAPEHVEERGHQLQDIILQHAQQLEPPAKPYTIASLAEWYKATKQLIENLSIDQRYKQAQIARLNARYAELMQDLMENLRP